jgi:hypothetical protein
MLAGDHLHSNSAKSTLRRAPCAWLGAEQGWISQWRNAQVHHDAMSERALTAWNVPMGFIGGSSVFAGTMPICFCRA